MLLFAVSVLFYSGTLMKLDLLQFQALCFLKEKKLKRFKRPIIHLIQFPYKSFDISSFVTVTVLLIQVALN